MSSFGRISLQQNAPIPTQENIVGASVAFWEYSRDGDCCVPVWNGSGWDKMPLSPIAIPLASIVVGKLYDFKMTSGGIILSPAWTDTQKRSEIVTKVQGIECDAGHNAILGTVYATANGQTAWQVKPSAVPYGTNNVLGITNVLNRMPVHARCRDLNPEWINDSAGIRFSNNSNLFRIWWIDPFGDVACVGKYRSNISGVNSSPAAATVGVALDGSYPANWNEYLGQTAVDSTAQGGPVEGEDFTLGSQGLRYYQAQEQSTPIPIRFFGNNFSVLTADLMI